MMNEIATIIGNNYNRQLRIKIAARYYTLRNGMNKADLF